MSGDARISGRIHIHPPITWAELRDKPWATGADQSWPDAFVKVAEVEANTDDGVVIRRTGTAIVPTDGETNGYDLLDNVSRIVAAFARTPDGVERAWSGWLHVIWGRGEDVYRVHVAGGRAVESKPALSWPAGARDEDGAL